MGASGTASEMSADDSAPDQLEQPSPKVDEDGDESLAEEEPMTKVDEDDAESFAAEQPASKVDKDDVESVTSQSTCVSICHDDSWGGWYCHRCGKTVPHSCVDALEVAGDGVDEV